MVSRLRIRWVQDVFGGCAGIALCMRIIASIVHRLLALHGWMEVLKVVLAHRLAESSDVLFPPCRRAIGDAS
jgi:hypothetical protein